MTDQPTRGPIIRAPALRFWGLAVATLLLSATVIALPGPAAEAQTQGAAPCVNLDGSVKTFAPGPPVKACEVPAGVTRLKAEVWGGQGGDNQRIFASTLRGGPGGYATRTVDVTPGSTLLIVGAYAGGTGSRTDQGGGGGGGSSGVYTLQPPQSLAQVIVIAGGGGGAGCDDGGAGGGIKGATESGKGGDGFDQGPCGAFRPRPGRGGGGGASGQGGESSINGGSGFGGNGGTPTPSGGAGGFGGSDLTGIGGPGHFIDSNAGAGGGGGYGGGGGGLGAGGAGGGSFPASSGPLNWGNGRVALSVPGAGVEANGCALAGTPGDDRLTATPHAEKLCGFAGDDRLAGDERRDRISGDGGDDVLLGGRGGDRLSGGPGFDVCNGNRGKDVADASCERVSSAVELG